MNTQYKIRFQWLLIETILVLGFMQVRAQADFDFGTARNLGPIINSSLDDGASCTSFDGLELYFGSNRPGGLGGWDLWMCRRESPNEPWGPPQNLGHPVNSSFNERFPKLTEDGLILYFSDNHTGTPRPGGQGGGDIWMTTRSSRNDPWTVPINLGHDINSSQLEFSPAVSGDDLIMVFSSFRSGSIGMVDLWMSTRDTSAENWSTPVNLGGHVNSSANDLECTLSGDGLVVAFSSNRGGGIGNYDVWMTTRKSREEPWLPAFNLGSKVNSSETEGSVGLSSDMNMLYFDSNHQGGFGNYDMYQSPINPVVDFTGDYRVDIKDLLILIENWGQNEPSVDMAPTPFGDGIVDVNDLTVLMSYWGQELDDPHFIAHWTLDEAEGQIAYDGISENDALVIGGTLWQPETGQIGGAIQLDGSSGYISTPTVLNPAEGSFSVFAWIKGGEPGQSIISQEGGAKWLMADPSAGQLSTRLSPPAGRSPIPALISNIVITDGNWHRVGLVWDGLDRILYVDSIEAAHDAVGYPGPASGGLYFGAGSLLEPDSFWSGLIDDVRIYDRAVTP